MKRLILFACAAFLTLLYWALAQTAPPPLANLFPSSPMLYLEAKDFGSLLADWNTSAEKRTWLAGANYQVFSRSGLFLKLGNAQTEFASAAGVPPDYALLSSIAGTNAALAIYNIGNLELLYISHLPSARALNTALWKARGNYQTRNAGGVDYYVKQDRASNRVAAFAYIGDLLLLATTEDLIAGALQLRSGAARPSVASEKWFTDSVQAAAPGPNDLRMVYDLERLERTPYFRSYWVQRNRGALHEFGSGLADLERARGELRERRVLLRATPARDLSSTEAAAGQLLALVPDTSGLYRAWAQPATEQAERWIEEKLFSAGEHSAPRTNQAPGLSTESEAGTEQDLEIRIDEAPLSDDRNAQAFAALRDSLRTVKLDAMLEVASTRVDADQVFVRPISAMVLSANEPWNAAQMRAAISSAAAALWTNSSLGAGWRAPAGGAQELDGLGGLIFAVDGKLLVVGDSPDLVAGLLARRNRTAEPGAVYTAGWRHARELPNFEKMMRLIDFPQIRVTPPGDRNEPGEPMFYSQNAASLGRTLQRVQSATIGIHDVGPLLRESIVYRLAP